MASAIGSLLLFVISLLVGGLGIYVGARVITGVEDYSHAVITALIGAIAWAVLSWIPLFGGLLALIAYVAVINWRYRGGWVNAILIALVAWIATAVVVFVLGALGVPVTGIGVLGA
ncbi:glucan phosphoethanolaminetransferase (alkaline phosphatase superfamily) [Halarchaeum solikamskense]|uniref:hypothetical protein n=1 Tax=Halarchaeum nitratireducens TaxID=489913 RepID=UPI001B3AB483|nr:hypothetical protein [Halarchaeum solikamskense]MBP2251668.1 glucan phosphoethanolaminetransferase (alkaline phosphatase superfamily) [Halarchaeum solikamskense]